MIGQKKLLSVGSGYVPFDQNPYAEERFQGWSETKLDIDPDTGSDIVNDILNMKDVNNDSFDAVYSQHLLEHLYTHEVEKALTEIHRVLKKGGVIALFLPDFEKIAKAIIEDDNIERVLYVCNGGVIRVIDMIFGYEQAIEGGRDKMLHKTAFTKSNVKKKLENAGFVNVEIKFDIWDMWVTASKIG